MNRKEAEQALETDGRKGLSEQEVLHRLAVYGKNEIQQKNRKKSWLMVFFAQFQDFMVLLLLGAAAISVVVSYGSGEKDFLDAAIIIGIVVLNAILGTVQEGRAEKALEALQKLSAPKARVLREGKERMIPSAQVVVGDILLLGAGDYICADGRVWEGNGLKTEESAVTGESMAVEKDADAVFSKDTSLGDRKNMVLSGGYVLAGKGRAIVTATGMKTEVGRIAAMLEDEENGATPLQKKLGQTGKLLGIVALLICTVIFCMGLLQQKPPFQMFMTSVSLAVAAIPEGLPAIVTIVLAMGMQRLSKKRTIVRRLPAVETLGSAEVICSDKTGTLTQNRMKVVEVANGKGKADASDTQEIFHFFTLCNDCDEEKGKFFGEPTEKALLEGAVYYGIDIHTLREEMPRIGEIPFSSARKRMTTLHRTQDGGWVSVTKGAPDLLLEHCRYMVEGQRQVVFDRGKKSAVQMYNGEMAARALRVVAVAFRLWEEKPPVDAEALEEDMVFVGMAGMVDPPRPEAKDAVRLCKEAGIRPVMITGDHVLTAEAIAEQLGIREKGDISVTGQELEKMSQEELEKSVKDCSVFARVAPEQKVRIVKAFQKGNHVVAMTGDGVNDAPALKVADIGCAMGKSGTEVAKGASDLILTDDNFATIVTAVQEGRGIYDNIQRAVHFLLSSNIGEILTIFAAMLLGWSSPLLPIQLLWVNLVTDSLPAMALGMEPAEKNIMTRPPRKQGRSLFSDGMGSKIVLEGMMIGMLALLAFGMGHIYFDGEGTYGVGRTMAFAVLSLSQLAHAFNMRGEQSLLQIPCWSNPWIWAALGIGILLQMGVLMIPALARIFCVTPLSGLQWLMTAGLAFAPIPIVEMEKALTIRREKRKSGKEHLQTANNNT